MFNDKLAGLPSNKYLPGKYLLLKNCFEFMIRLFFFSCAILFTIQLNAQRIGVKAGLALASYNAIGRQHPDPYYSKSIINTTLKPGIIVGGYADFELNKNLFLRPGT